MTPSLPFFISRFWFFCPFRSNSRRRFCAWNLCHVTFYRQQLEKSPKKESEAGVPTMGQLLISVYEDACSPSLSEMRHGRNLRPNLVPSPTRLIKGGCFVPNPTLYSSLRRAIATTLGSLPSHKFQGPPKKGGPLTFSENCGNF